MRAAQAWCWRPLALIALGLLSAGCGQSMQGLVSGSSTMGYEAASILSPLGYSDTQLAPDRYRIVVGGRPTTPKARLELIATVRAAEIGVEERLGSFKIESMTVTEKCTPAKPEGPRSAGHGELRYAILTAEVTYAKTPPDPSFRAAKATFETLRPELDRETQPLDPTPAISPQGGCS